MGNMLFLFFLGSPLEARIGKRRFAVVYFSAGIVGALLAAVAYLAVGDNPYVYMIGASGAISGAVGALLVLYPRDEIPMLLGPIFLPRVPVWLSALSWLLFSVLLAILIPSNVSWEAHVGGFMAGLVVGLLIGRNVEEQRRKDEAPLDYSKLEPLATTPQLKNALENIKKESHKDSPECVARVLRRTCPMSEVRRKDEVPQGPFRLPVRQRGRDPVITVQVVCEGYLHKEDGIVIEAHSTASLITSGRFLVLVDTSSKERRPHLLEGLRSLDVEPGDIEVVVNTHMHHDHIGNDDLFPRALKMARHEEGPGPGFEAVGEDRELRPGIRLIHTPGHTRGSMSVVVEADDARYVIAGDAMPTKDNYDRWVPPGINYDVDTALRSMRRIVDEAEVIVPGHGAPFAIERFYRFA